MSPSKPILNCTLAIAVLFGCTAVAVSREAKKIFVSSGLAKVQVTRVEKIKNTALLPPNVCDPLNTGETVVVSLEIAESTGYVQEKIYVQLPSGEKGQVKAPLIDPESIAVGNSYWIAFTKSFAENEGASTNPKGVAWIWAEIDSDTEKFFEQLIENDRLKAQYEYAPHLTDIGFALENPVGKAEQLFPMINYLNREIELIKKQQREDGKLLGAFLKSMDLVPTGRGYSVPELPEATRNKIELLRGTWPNNHVFETGYEFKQPPPKSLCSVCSWEPGSFTQHFLNARNGGRFIVVRYEIEATKSGPKSVLKLICEYSRADKLVAKREFISPETEDEKRVVQLETTFDPEGKILTTEASTIVPKYSARRF